MSDRDEHNFNGRSVPLWFGTHPPVESWRDLPDGEIDVLVIGAGVAGLSVAYHLLRAGRRVLVIDKSPVGAGETGRSSAHVSSALDDHFYLLERMHGERGAKLAAESHTEAIKSILEIAARERFDCGARSVDGYLYAERGDQHERRALEQEYQAARRAGLDVRWVDRTPLPFDTEGALCFAGQAEIDPMAYLRGLAAAVERLGGTIRTGLHVESVSSADKPVVRIREHEPLAVQAVVVATNTPINDVVTIHAKQAAYRSYVLALEIPPGSLQPALYWDLKDPYHYIRLVGDDVLLVGGEDHKVGQCRSPEQSWERLLTWTRERFPSAGDVRSGWSGQIFEPADGMAFIGKNPGPSHNVFIATGDSGNGVTHGAIAGLLLTDLIIGRKNPWTGLYDPSRKPVDATSLRTFMKENVNVAAQYRDWVAPSERAPEGRSQGYVERRGVQRVAVYVAADGERHACSARCPHLGAAVRWNSAEGSWDCPAHGSRFDPRGRVVTGPAKQDLSSLETSLAADGPPSE